MNRVSKMVRTGPAGSPIYERTIYIDGIFEYHILENGTTYEKNYVHIMDDQSRIAMVRIGTPFPDDIIDAITYNLEDQIGSSSVRLNTTGGVIDKEEYYPFGDSSLRTFSKKRYRYSGKEKDQESGLYYYGARYYSAWTCRFISVDPKSAEFDWQNSYAFAANNPIMLVDVNGEGPGRRLRGLMRRKKSITDKYQEATLNTFKKKRLGSRKDKLQRKINALAQKHNSETDPKGRVPKAVFDEGGSIYSGDSISGNTMEVYNRDVAPRARELGYRAALVNDDGSFTILNIGKPSGDTDSDGFAPVWSESGIKSLEEHLGEALNIEAGEFINFNDDWAILDNDGEIIVEALPNLYVGGSVGLYQAGETVFEVDSSGIVTGTFDAVGEDTIIHYTKEVTLDSNQNVVKSENKRETSNNINQLRNR